MLTTKVKGIGQMAVWFALSMVLIALSFVDVTPLFGVSQKALSVGSLLMPLTGALTGWLAFFVAATRSAFGFFSTGSYLSFALYLPGLCAALAWRSNSRLLHVLLPLACMFAFVAHPQGAQAVFYSMYWLVPVVLSLACYNRTLFGRALAATFIAHAVGSVVWLYAYAIPAAVWNSLIPVVLFERLLFALALVSVYNTAHVVVSIVQSHVSRRYLQVWKKRSII